jgi:high-affinity iron transporter
MTVTAFGAVVAAVVMAAGLYGCGGTQRVAPRGRPERITLAAASCASGWSAPSAGVYDFAVDNRASVAASAFLVQPGSGVVIAKVTNAQPRTVSELAVHLVPGGAYQWSCDLAGVPARLSTAAQVPWPAANRANAPPVPAPVATVQLIGPLTQYRQYVDGLLATLRPQLGKLQAQIAAGSLAGAQAAWLTARLTWLKIGQDDGAYGAFGQLGSSIDGTADGIVGGTSSSQFTGFHKVELDLWTRHDLAAAGRDAAELARLVATLTPGAVAAALPANTPGINNWTLRCHEILEDALRDSLSENDDYGSNSDLASINADVAATHEMLGLLAPLINPRSPQLVATGERDLTALSQAVAAARTGAQWPDLASLPVRERQRIDAATGAALETLAPVSELMQIGST